MTQPVVYMIAGPNGAGKTTLALRVLSEFFSVHEFVNADEIARGLNPLKPEGQAIPAGKLMLRRIENLIAASVNFSFETTGASHNFVSAIKQAKVQGYKFGLFYVWLPNAEMAKKRVRFRVSQGGHNIPDDVIERRYKRSIQNLIHLYLPLADKADIYNGAASRKSKRRVIAAKSGDNFVVYKPTLWHNITGLAEEE